MRQLKVVLIGAGSNSFGRGTLADLATGGSASGLNTNTAEAIRIVDEALGDLTRVEGQVDGFYDAAITSASNLLSDLESDRLFDTVPAAGSACQRPVRREDPALSANVLHRQGGGGRCTPFDPAWHGLMMGSSHWR